MTFVYIFVACGLVNVLLGWWAGMYGVYRGGGEAWITLPVHVLFDFLFWWVQFLYYLLSLFLMAGDSVMYRLWR